MAFALPSARRRIAAALAAGTVQLGLAALAIWGLAVHWSAPGLAPPALVTIIPSKEPPPKPASPAVRETIAAPASRGREALPHAAPSPAVILAAPLPAAPVAGSGNQDGEGTEGQGSGAGAGGLGTGGGAISPPVRIGGALSDRDYPRGVRASGTTAVSFRVRSDGRVDRCAVIASSGEPRLDELTCTLAERRFRYRPARYASGQPVEAVLQASFTWGMRQRD